MDFVSSAETPDICGNALIGARRLNLIIWVLNNHRASENVFYCASSPTVTSDTAVQASVQQHGFFWAASRSQPSALLGHKYGYCPRRKLKSFVMLSVLCPDVGPSSDVKKSGGLPAGHAAPQEGSFFLNNCTLQRFTQTQAADNQRSWHKKQL